MRALLVLVAGAAALALFTGAYTPPNSKLTIGITRIDAHFIPAKRATVYSVTWGRLAGSKLTKATATWTLTLKLVDPAGAAAPGEPGSAAAVDLGCTNDLVGLPGHEQTSKETLEPRFSFTWHHPDAVDSDPPGKYHCNHAEMGPHGHQGLIRVTISDKKWACTATFKGTNSSTAASDKDGTASFPTCKKLF